MENTCCSFKKYIAEMIGTCVLVLMGCGAAALAGGSIGWLGVSLAFGLSVMVMVYAIGPIWLPHQPRHHACHAHQWQNFRQGCPFVLGIPDHRWFHRYSAPRLHRWSF